MIQSSNVYALYGPSPATQTISLGHAASFTVMAGGLNPRYQWRHAGTNIVNATGSGNTLQKTGGCDGCQDAGGVSQQQIASGTGGAQFSPGGVLMPNSVDC